MKKYKILFVDDDHLMLAIMVHNFSEAGIEIYTLESADGNFVDKVMNVTPDLIFLDIIMLSRTGFEAIELLKANLKTKDIPVMFFTNLNQAVDINKGIKLGAIDYLLTMETTPSDVIKAGLDYLNNPIGYIKRYNAYLETSKQ